MTEGVRRDPHAFAHGPGVALEYEPEPLPGHPASAGVQEERALLAAARNQRPRRFEVLRERFVAPSGNGSVSLRSAPARAAHERPLAVEMNIVDVERDQLADTHAGGVQQLEHRAVAPSFRRRAAGRLLEQRGDLPGANRSGQHAGDPGAGKALGRVTAQYPFVREEDEEGARGRELAGDRSVAIAAFLQPSDELLEGCPVKR